MLLSVSPPRATDCPPHLASVHSSSSSFAFPDFQPKAFGLAADRQVLRRASAVIVPTEAMPASPAEERTTSCAAEREMLSPAAGRGFFNSHSALMPAPMGTWPAGFHATGSPGVKRGAAPCSSSASSPDGRRPPGQPRGKRPLQEMKVIAPFSALGAEETSSGLTDVRQSVLGVHYFTLWRLPMAMAAGEKRLLPAQDSFGQEEDAFHRGSRGCGRSSRGERGV